MKKINLILSVLVLLLVLAGCDNNPAEVKVKDPDGVLEEEEGKSLEGEWHEVNSADNWGTKVTFTETTMSIIGYGFTSESNIWKDTLIMYTDNLGYKIAGDDTLEFEYRPPISKETPNYRVYYTFRSEDTLFIEKIWPNSFITVSPPFVDDILLYRRTNK